MSQRGAYLESEALVRRVCYERHSTYQDRCFRIEKDVALVSAIQQTEYETGPPSAKSKASHFWMGYFRIDVTIDIQESFRGET